MLYTITKALRIGLVATVAHIISCAIGFCDSLQHQNPYEAPKKSSHSPSLLLSIDSSMNPVEHIMTMSVKRMLPILQMKGGEFLTPTMQHIFDEIAGTHCYGIHRNEQQIEGDVKGTEKRYAEIKSHLLATMDLSPTTTFFEIVGDAAVFSLAGSQRAVQFLNEYLPDNAVWIYGYTGLEKEDGTRCVNGAVSHLVEDRKHIDKTIGNFVAFHTPLAIDEWGCSGPFLNHYILVYGDDETNQKTGTVFSDDIITSDFLSDQLLMIEGGTQSFRQACNFLLLERPILGINNLRGVLPNGPNQKIFSAPEFLHFIKTCFANCKEPISDKLLDSWFDAFFTTHLIADPKRPDYDIKEKLLAHTWKFFKENRLHEKLSFFRLLP